DVDDGGLCVAVFGVVAAGEHRDFLHGGEVHPGVVVGDEAAIEVDVVQEVDDLRAVAATEAALVDTGLQLDHLVAALDGSLSEAPFGHHLLGGGAVHLDGRPGGGDGDLFPFEDGRGEREVDGSRFVDVDLDPGLRDGLIPHEGSGDVIGAGGHVQDEVVAVD